MTKYTGIVKVYGNRDEEKYFLYLQTDNSCRSWEKKEFKQFEDITDFINQSFPISENILRRIIKIKKPLTERELNNFKSDCYDYHV